jgi:hypothetical protein
LEVSSGFPLPQTEGASSLTGTVHARIDRLGVRVTLIEGKCARTKRVKLPLIASDGPKVDLTNEKIYEVRLFRFNNLSRMESPHSGRNHLVWK